MAINNTIAILGFLLLTAALGTQFASYMNLDNAWLLHVAENVVHGQKLHVDVVETNPPLIVYFMMLPVYLGMLLGIGSVNGFIIFIASLVLFSLGLSFTLVKDNRIRLILLFAMAFMPAMNFGEREHIFMALMLPYFVSLWSNDKKSLWFIVISALMAGVALSIKPFFLLIWGVLALTKMVLDRRFFAFFTLQNIIIGLIVTIYPLYLFFIEKTYVEEILPLMLKYYGGYNSPPLELFKQSLGMIILGQVAFWVLFIKDRSILTRPVYFANFGNLAAVGVMVVQGKVWSNYLYPPDAFSFITNSLIIFALLDGNVKPLWNKVAAIISSFLLVVYVTMALAVNIKIGFGIREEYEDKLVEIFNGKAAGKNVMTLNFDLGAAFPGIMASEANFSSRYGCLWMLPGIYADQKPVNNRLQYRSPQEKGEDEAMVARHVIEDFKKTRPELVVVIKSEYYSPGMGSYGFDFVEYFSKEPEFKEMWEKYEKIAVIGEKKDEYFKEIWALKK